MSRSIRRIEPTVHDFAELPSTSDEARRLLGQGATELPFLIRTRRQTAGRGRGTNRWYSDEGSLTLTLALDPDAHGLSPAHQARAALAVAVAVLDAVADHLPPGAGGIRWPNDIEVADRKLAGILPERVATPRGWALLIGLGLNLRTRLDQAPPEVGRMATALWLERPDTAHRLDHDTMQAAILDHLARTLAALSRDDPGLASRWAALDTLRDRTVHIDQGAGRILTGVGAGISPDGGLRVRTEDGVVTLHGGSVLRDA